MSQLGPTMSFSVVYTGEQDPLNSVDWTLADGFIMVSVYPSEKDQKEAISLRVFVLAAPLA